MSNELLGLRNKISELKLKSELNLKKYKKISVKILPGLSPVTLALLAELLTKNRRKPNDN